MSLQIWLPLNGNLENQGLTDIEATNAGATTNANGKIGSCYYFNGTSSRIGFPEIAISYPISICAWIKGETITASGTEYILSYNIPTGGTLGHAIGFGTYTGKLSIWHGGTVHSYGTALTNNVWYHVAAVVTESSYGLYLNGNLVLSGSGTQKAVNSKCITIGARSNNSGGGIAGAAYFFKGFMNDVRIYDHALSAKEVRELAKGLVLHYKLDENLNVLTNCYAKPTFDTSASAGGWSHWGRSGASGSYGQNTDGAYIFNKSQTYSHWVANASTATGEYLLYQSPTFAGGHRSLQCICKEENSARIDESIVFPAWNARSGGAPSYEWTSVSSLGNGFYLCKCEDIQQNGSDDLVGFYTCPGHKVYFSEAYLENDQAICSDIFNQDFLNIVHDSSGFGYNGTIVGTFSATSDSPRYAKSTQYGGSNYSKCTSPTTEARTISFWAKWNSIPSGQSVLYVDYKSKTGFGLTSRGVLCSSCGLNSYTFSKANIVANTWYHFVIVCPNGGADASRKLYINGVEQTQTSYTSNWTFSIDELQLGKRSTTSDGFGGKMSDFRMYSTALSADDILELYHTSASIDKSGSIYARELVE